MAEEKNKTVMTGFKLPIDLVNEMDKYNDKTGITKTRMVIDGLKLYFARRKND